MAEGLPICGGDATQREYRGASGGYARGAERFQANTPEYLPGPQTFLKYRTKKNEVGAVPYRVRHLGERVAAYAHGARGAARGNVEAVHLSRGKLAIPCGKVYAIGARRCGDVGASVHKQLRPQRTGSAGRNGVELLNCCPRHLEELARGQLLFADLYEVDALPCPAPKQTAQAFRYRRDLRATRLTRIVG